ASASVLHNGDVLMCTHDWAREEVLGNLREHSLAELWNGPRMRANREQTREHRPPDPACASCDRVCKSFFAERPPRLPTV
ncbi:MAG TPA: SPASM domain-containing protein, partial [Myxococcales bacterium]|nr:SPASM domain-containing protein [Myxococcales bacterium]